MAVQVEIWENHIVETLWKKNPFLTFAFNADEYVNNGKVVHIPQEGGPGTVTKNRTTYPGVVSRRTDDDVTYPLEEYTTEPRHIPDADTKELSYDKRSSVINQEENNLKQATAEDMLIKWAPATAAGIIRTSGINGDLDSDGNLVVKKYATHLSGSTGNRVGFSHLDLANAQTLFDEQDIDEENRVALMSARMYRQFVDSLSTSQYKDFSRYFDAAKGVLGELYGFKVLKRSTVLRYDNQSTPVVKPFGSAAAATDNDAVLCWQANSVERALGTVKMFENTQDALFYGDVYSFLLRMGGRIRREDAKGVVAIVQAAAA